MIEKKTMDERFLRVRELADQVKAGEKLLPEKIFLGIENTEEGIEFHNVAVNLWRDTYKEAEVIETLRQISQFPANYTSEIHQRLRIVRIAGVILRDANRIYSESHYNPEFFYKFTKILGTFNDNFGTNITDPMVSEVLTAMEKSKEEEDRWRFIPCSPESLEGYLKREIELIVNSLGKSELSTGMLHSLRRTSRQFLNLFLLKTLKDSDMESFGEYVYLREVNTSLGECLDERKNNGEAGESEDLIRVPEFAKELMTKFLTRVVWK